MLQIVDADTGSNRPKPDGAEVACDLDAVLVRRVDGGLQLGVRDIHVRFEGCDAFGDPILHGPDGVFRPGELVHLRGERAFAFEIRAGDPELGTGHFAGVDELLHAEVGVGFETAAGARGSDTAGEIESREAEGLLIVSGDAVTRVVKQVFVHPHESRDHSVAGEVDGLRAGRHGDERRRSERRDFAVVEDDRLVLTRCGAGAIDHPCVLQRDHRSADRDEGSVARCETILRHRYAGEQKNPKELHPAQLYREGVRSQETEYGWRLAIVCALP